MDHLRNFFWIFFLFRKQTNFNFFRLCRVDRHEGISESSGRFWFSEQIVSEIQCQKFFLVAKVDVNPIIWFDSHCHIFSPEKLSQNLDTKCCCYVGYWAHNLGGSCQVLDWFEIIFGLFTYRAGLESSLELGSDMEECFITADRILMFVVDWEFELRCELSLHVFEREEEEIREIMAFGIEDSFLSIFRELFFEGSWLLPSLRKAHLVTNDKIYISTKDRSVVCKLANRQCGWCATYKLVKKFV